MMLFGHSYRHNTSYATAIPFMHAVFELSQNLIVYLADTMFHLNQDVVTAIAYIFFSFGGNNSL